MSLSSKVILSFVAGTCSAALAWVVVDFNPFHTVSGLPQAGSFLEIFSQQAFVGVVFGMFVGVAIGLVNGISTGSSRLVTRYAGWGVIVGIGGGLLGLFFGQLFFGPLYVQPSELSATQAVGPLLFIWDVLIRAIGWGFIGLFLGLVQGLPAGSGKAARYGAIGGFIGGLLGGTLFEIVPYILPEDVRHVSVVSRAIGMTVTGACIGLFVGLVELLMKQAWIRVVAGRNEGREYVISKPRTTIGRDELSDVGLFGDREIAPTHVVIEAQAGRHMIHDMGAPVGTAVNGQRITQDTLRDGDMIEIGSRKLEFHEKATASRIPKPVDTAPEPGVQIPTMAGICPFCGTKKDPNTGACACSVSAQPGAPAAPPAQPVPGAAPVAAPTAAGPRLVGTGGPYAGQSFPLSPSGSTNIGREPGRDVQLPADTTVSRQHARVDYEGGAFVLYDEGSSNGTQVNGARIARQPLASGDVVEFGSSSFRFEA